MNDAIKHAISEHNHEHGTMSREDELVFVYNLGRAADALDSQPADGDTLRVGAVEKLIKQIGEK